MNTTAAAITAILSCAFIAYHLDGSLGGHGPVIAVGQTALPFGLPAWMGGSAG